MPHSMLRYIFNWGDVLNMEFKKSELEIKKWIPGRAGEVPVYNTPVTMKEGYKALLNKKPIWQITGVEDTLFCPKVIPDNVARGQVFEAEAMPASEFGGKDMFGIEWEYVEQVGGSMVRPGKPFLEDANEWYDKLVWTDIDKWDWSGAAKANKDHLDPEYFNVMWILNGWYERLISFMDFEGAIMAMVDEDQTDAVKELFMKLSELYIRIIDRSLEAFPNIDCICIHDDWGSQKDTFFSPTVVAEMIVPAMRAVTDHIHSKGRYTKLHSCGQLYKQIPNMIAAGWDMWSGQDINDTHRIYEEYGDRIIIGVMPDEYNISDSTEEEQRKMAANFAEKFCVPDKPCIINSCGLGYLTKAYRDELY